MAFSPNLDDIMRKQDEVDLGPFGLYGTVLGRTGQHRLPWAR